MSRTYREGFLLLKLTLPFAADSLELSGTEIDDNPLLLLRFRYPANHRQMHWSDRGNLHVDVHVGSDSGERSTHCERAGNVEVTACIVLKVHGDRRGSC